MNKKEKIKKIYEAAELIECGRVYGACRALASTNPHSITRASTEFNDLFQIDAIMLGHCGGYWAVNKDEDEASSYLDRISIKDRRVMLLCMYAELVRTGDIGEILESIQEQYA